MVRFTLTVAVATSLVIIGSVSTSAHSRILGARVLAAEANHIRGIIGDPAPGHAFERANAPDSRAPSPDAIVETASCFGKAPTITGTAGDDTLTGSNGPDVILGLEGNDTIEGLSGRDLLCGGPGDDILFGDSGSDAVSGDDGEDVIDGGSGADLLLGGAGDIDGILGSQGADVIDGGPGVADFASYFQAPAGVRVNLATGRATGGAGRDQLSGIEVLQGSPHDDVLIGNDQINFLVGGLGPDGNDVLDGGGSLDVAAFFFSENTIHANLAAGTASGQGSDRLEEIESVAGSPQPDSLAGNDEQNSLFGGDGNDELSGAGGNDFLNGEDGHDRLEGGEGDDALTGEGGDDFLQGGPGSIDAANYLVAPAPISADLVVGTAFGWGVDSLTGIEGLVGSSFADDLRGSEVANSLDGKGGDDILFGLAGADLLTGGDGDDELRGGEGDDGLAGDAGTNTLNGDEGTDDCFDAGSAVNCETGLDGAPTTLFPTPTNEPPPPGQSQQPLVESAIVPARIVTEYPGLTWGALNPAKCFTQQIQIGYPFWADHSSPLLTREGIWWGTILWKWVDGIGWLKLDSVWWTPGVLNSSSVWSESPTVHVYNVFQPGIYGVTGRLWWNRLADFKEDSQIPHVKFSILTGDFFPPKFFCQFP